MANDPDPETPVSVATGEVRVGKAFEADRFPVPAIAFEIESLADEPVRIRLVDQIPESFAMEGVGFHPDYDSENWTAYRDHRVAYERTLDPGESVLTVYGIRIDDPEAADQFLDEPTVELIEPDDVTPGSDEVLGRDTTQVVRDALSGGDPSELSGMATDADSDDSGPEPLLGGRDPDPAPAPRARAEDLTAALGDRDDDVTAVGTAEDSGAEATENGGDGEDESDAEEVVAPADAATALDPRSDESVESDEGSKTDEGVESDDNPTTAAGAVAGPTAAPGSVAAALAAEIREGTVDDDDLAVLHEAFEGAVPTSVDVRVGRLQSQVEDVLAYRDALADFLDENGTAEEVLGDVSEEVSDLNDRVDALDESLSTAATERDDLQSAVGDAADAVDDVSERVGAVEDELAGVESRLARLDERLESVETLEEDLVDVHEELDDLRAFRDRLNSAFGPGEE